MKKLLLKLQTYLRVIRPWTRDRPQRQRRRAKRRNRSLKLANPAEKSRVPLLAAAWLGISTTRSSDLRSSYASKTKFKILLQTLRSFYTPNVTVLIPLKGLAPL